MLYSGTDPESYITEYFQYTKKNRQNPNVFLKESASKNHRLERSVRIGGYPTRLGQDSVPTL